MENEENKIIFKVELKKDGELNLKSDGVDTLKLASVISHIIYNMAKASGEKDELTEAKDILEMVKALVAVRLMSNELDEE